jgi:hypothetical protein
MPMLIRRCPIWLLGAVIITLAVSTTALMANRAHVNGEADSLLAALLAQPASSPGPESTAGLRPRLAAPSTVPAQRAVPPGRLAAAAR